MTITTIENATEAKLDDSIFLSEQPVLLRGLISDWPIVRKANVSTADAITYLSTQYNGTQVTVVEGEPDISGRIAYSEDFTALNCKSSRRSLPDAINLILGEAGQDQPKLYYMGTTLTESIMPSFRSNNDLKLNKPANQFMWMGNRSCVPAHFDLPDNIACNVVGHRRFTLFPPDQFKNLYVGPLDFTPAGQAISLVDIRKPDLEKYPLYAQAQQHAVVAELEPGDALFIPSLWWHNVEGLDDINILINYWWRQTPAYLSSPADVLDLALLSIRSLPKAQKNAWKALIDHYIFNDDVDAFAHIPKSARGVLGDIDDTLARKIRAKILARLNR